MGTLRIVIYFMLCVYVYVISSAILYMLLLSYYLYKKMFGELSETLGYFLLDSLVGHYKNIPYT